MAEFTIERKDYQLDYVIGQGATAIVMAATFTAPETQSKIKCAVKQINLDKNNENIQNIAQEVQHMLMSRHENIVRYYTSFVVSNELWLVMNLLGGGSVYDIIKQRQKQQNCDHGVLEEVEIATVLLEATKGLEYLHTNGQIHRDIKGAYADYNFKPQLICFSSHYISLKMASSILEAKMTLYLCNA